VEMIVLRYPKGFIDTPTKIIAQIVTNYNHCLNKSSLKKETNGFGAKVKLLYCTVNISDGEKFWTDLFWDTFFVRSFLQVMYSFS